MTLVAGAERAPRRLAHPDELAARFAARPLAIEALPGVRQASSRPAWTTRHEAPGRDVASWIA